ncbi:MAG: hypothetical protein NT069_29230 [Planctomycetota bacterium]|nr:hypothetical protein [Planctomycetota bacterium]
MSKRQSKSPASKGPSAAIVPVADTEEKMRRLHQAFDPRPLEADQTDLYVNLDEVRGEADIATRLYRPIVYAKQPTVQLLAGHKGSGKSTELRRLRQRLEQGTSKFFTLLVTERDIDPNNVGFAEVLIVLLQRVAAEVELREKIRLKPGYFAERFQQLKDLLFSEVALEKIELPVLLGKVSASIRHSPDARDQLRKLLEPDTSNLLKGANELIDEATDRLKENGYAGLVVLFDSLDHMDDQAQATGLFVRRANEMTGFRCHVVYTMPLSLAYSEQLAQLSMDYGSQPPIVPMTKIHTRPPKRARHEPGYQKFREVIAARLKHAGFTEKDLFASDAVRDTLIEVTGGQPTQLMTFVQDALIADGLPIQSEAIERLVRERRRDYRWLLREDWPVLEAIRQTGAFVADEKTEPIFKRLLDSRAALHYVNHDEWYDLNPLVAQITPPAESVAP